MLLQLKVHAITCKNMVEEGLERDISNLQGYASFFDKTDFFVIGYNMNYKENMLLLIFGLIALVTFITMTTPLMLSTQ